jgi:hypothetical protein
MRIDDESNRLMTAMLNMLAESDPRLSQELTAAVNRQIDANADKTLRKRAKLLLLSKQKQTTFRELARKVAAMDEFASIASNPRTSTVFTHIFELSEEARMPGSFESRYNRQYEDER